MESIRPDELSSIIKEQIKRYEDNMNVDEIGNVVTIGDGIALIYGLNNVMAGELLAFPNDVFGMALNLEQDSVGAVLMGDISNIKEGDIVKRTGEIVKVPVGDALLGRVVNAIGQPVDGLGTIEHTEMRPVERVASGVMTRKSVTRPLQTGIKAIDGMIPIGRGQRELIIGDRQTGKTTIAIDTIINQKGKGVKCVYVAIGQKNSTVAQIVETLRKHDALAYTTIVLATASELAPLQYIAPYAGCAIGEFWMDNGEDVLLVYDDLSKHAVAYRTLSLLLRRPPGREAYPGDVFYLHSRLLERAAQLNEQYGGGSLTALPIIETLAGDISAYIPTNVISITDGQIFLKTDFFNAGQRPAIDSAFSVSRVGSAAQVKAMKQVAGSIKLELAQYQELEAFSQFGSDLDAITQEVLDHGAKVLEVLKQRQGQPGEVVDQVIIMFALKKRLTKTVPVKYIKDYETALVSHMHDKHSQIVDTIVTDLAISDDLDKMMLDAITDFTSEFVQTVVE